MARILCVEDEPSIRDFYARLLHALGHLADTASDGFEGLERIQTEEYDVVLSDVYMPGLDGVQMLSRARPYLQGRTPTVLEVAGSGTSEAEEAVADCIFSLFGGLTELLAILAWALAERRRRLEHAHVAQALRRPTHGPYPLPGTQREDGPPPRESAGEFARRCHLPEFEFEGPRADRARVEQALERYCQARSLPAPRVLWSGSPLEGCRLVALGLPGTNDRSTLGEAITGPSPGPLAGATSWRDPAEASSLICAELYARFRRLPLALQPGCFLAALRGVDAQRIAAHAVREPDASLAAEREVCETLAAEAGWFWLFDDGFAVVTEPHGGLQACPASTADNSDASQVMYPDGFGAWTLQGFRVPQGHVERPHEVPISVIKKTRNAELRRLLRKRYGESRYLEALAARLIAVDTVPVDAAVPGGACLTRALIEDQEGDRYLVSSDGSTRRVYHMPVPSTCTNCREAYEALSGRSDVRTIVEA